VVQLRAVNEELLQRLFAALGQDRGRALVATALSSGVRASVQVGRAVHVDVPLTLGCASPATKAAQPNASRHCAARSGSRSRVSRSTLRPATRTASPQPHTRC